MYALSMLILDIAVPTLHMLIGICNNQVKHEVAIPVTSCLPFNCWISTPSSSFGFLDNWSREELTETRYPIWQVGRWVTLLRVLSFSIACWRSRDNQHELFACLGWVQWVCLCSHRTNFKAKWDDALQEFLLIAQGKDGFSYPTSLWSQN